MGINERDRNERNAMKWRKGVNYSTLSFSYLCLLEACLNIFLCGPEKNQELQSVQ